MCIHLLIVYMVGAFMRLDIDLQQGDFSHSIFCSEKIFRYINAIVKIYYRRDGCL